MITRTTCRVCDGSLESVLDLGEQYVSDFISPGDSDGTKAPLELVLCRRCRLLQLKHTVPGETMYRNYWYRSGTNQTMRNALADIANKAETLIHLHAGDSVVDIGCNDGTLLASLQNRWDPEDRVRSGGEPGRLLAESRRQAGGRIFRGRSVPSRRGPSRVPPEGSHEHRHVLRPREPQQVRFRHQERDGPGGALDRPDELPAPDAEDERIRQHLPRAPRVLLPEVVRVPSEPARVRDRRRGTERHQRRKPAGVHPEPERRPEPVRGRDVP